MSAPICPKCRTRPRFEYKSEATDRGRYGPTCRECWRPRRSRSPQPSERQLHRMADQYRPRDANAETKTADPQARPQLRKKEFD